MALQLVHSTRHAAEDPDSAHEPALSLLQGGRDPVAEEAAMVAEIYRQRDEEIAKIRAKIRARSAESKRLHDERMEQLRSGHAARMKAMDEAHQVAMKKISDDATKYRIASRRRYESDMRAMCGFLAMVAAYASGTLLAGGMSPMVLLLVPLAVGAFYAIRLIVEAIV